MPTLKIETTQDERAKDIAAYFKKADDFNALADNEKSFWSDLLSRETEEYQPRFNRIERARLAFEYAKSFKR